MACSVRNWLLWDCVLLVFLVFLISLSSASNSESESETQGRQKVSVGLYYESLCPYSANFIVNYLAHIFHNGLISIVDLNLVPYGNARIRPNTTTITCQHGPSECFLNTVEACAIKTWPQLNQHFPFVYCVESLVYEHKFPQWEKCFEELQLDPQPIVDCYDSGYGKELELQYAAETNSLVPPHEYVPWVVVDGQPLYEDYENFEIYVCKAYKGTPKPKACNELDLSINPVATAVTYVGEKIKPALSTRIISVVASCMRHMHMAFSA